MCDVWQRSSALKLVRSARGVPEPLFARKRRAAPAGACPQAWEKEREREREEDVACGSRATEGGG